MTSVKVVGIDLAAKPENPTGLACLKYKEVRACIVHTCGEILSNVREFEPLLVAVDAPLKSPKIGIFRKAESQMLKRGYKIFPPGLPAMKMLTDRAERLNGMMSEEGYRIIEVHPTSTRKALNILTKYRGRVQAILKSMGLEGDLLLRDLSRHELDATISALTAWLHIRGETEAFGDLEEGFIIVPKTQDWRELKL